MRRALRHRRHHPLHYLMMSFCRLLLVVCVPCLLLACGAEVAPLEKGRAPPSFTLRQLDAQPLRFPADVGDAVVALRFWADWCPFCASEMRALEPVYHQYQSRGLRILAINVRQDRATAQAFIDKLGVSYDVLLDETGEVARGYGVAGLPTTVFIDRQGRLNTPILGE